MAVYQNKRVKIIMNSEVLYKIILHKIKFINRNVNNYMNWLKDGIKLLSLKNINYNTIWSLLQEE